MDRDQLQLLRYKLQKRVRRLNSAEYQVFHYMLKQFWGFLQSQPLITGVMDHLESTMSRINEEVEPIFSQQSGIVFEKEIENAAACYFVLKRCAESSNNHVEIDVGASYSNESKFNDVLESFKDIFLEPFYDYLDEHLDEARAVLALIIKYKKRCEWFKRQELLDAWLEKTSKGEKTLALDMYEYLFQQGLDFYIEPSSVSGEVDLISSQIGDERLLADAKIYNPEKGKGKEYILSGFNQLYTYAVDYNEPVAYLVIFETSEDRLCFSVNETYHHTPFITHNNKTIFFIVIDLFEWKESASKRGKLKTAEITESDLVGVVTESSSH